MPSVSFSNEEGATLVVLLACTTYWAAGVVSMKFKQYIRFWLLDFLGTMAGVHYLATRTDWLKERSLYRELWQGLYRATLCSATLLLVNFERQWHEMLLEIATGALCFVTAFANGAAELMAYGALLGLFCLAWLPILYRRGAARPGSGVALGLAILGGALGAVAGALQLYMSWSATGELTLVAVRHASWGLGMTAAVFSLRDPRVLDGYLLVDR